MKAYCTIILLFITNAAFCCVCRPGKPFEKKEDLKGYDFIALVTIRELASLDDDKSMFRIRTNGKIKADVIELFKGDISADFIDPDFHNDCAMNLFAGEQWIFFGNKVKDEIQVYHCGYSVRYRESDGLRDWTYFQGLKELNVLRSIFDKQLNSNILEIQKYPDGKVELEQKFKNGKLNGIRTVYYPDGKIYLTEKFKSGIRVGDRDIYNPNGSLYSTKTFKNGLAKKWVTYIDSNDVLGEIRHRIAYSKLWKEPDYQNVLYAIKKNLIH